MKSLSVLIAYLVGVTLQSILRRRCGSCQQRRWLPSVMRAVRQASHQPAAVRLHHQLVAVMCQPAAVPVVPAVRLQHHHRLTLTAPVRRTPARRVPVLPHHIRCRRTPARRVPVLPHHIRCRRTPARRVPVLPHHIRCRRVPARRVPVLPHHARCRRPSAWLHDALRCL